MIVRVALEIALHREFDYQVPPEWKSAVGVGSRVKVPFGRRQMLGLVTGINPATPHQKLKPILKVLGRQSLVTPSVLRLARWMAEYYCCPLETALKSVLPVAVRKEEAGWKEQLYVYPLTPFDSEYRPTRRQLELLTIIREHQGIFLRDLITRTGSNTTTVRRLEDRGWVSIEPKVMERDPYARTTILPSQPLALNPEQNRAMQAIMNALHRQSKSRLGFVNRSQSVAVPLPASVDSAPGTFLLHGVTGSGKTEVYLQAIDFILESGQGAIVLVPEISLTPQTVERFKARFCTGKHRTLVAVLHSHLSVGERHDEWHKIRDGRARIVIGARSAVFAPVDPLGLIIVDEEHEPSYKQEEAPRYQARDLAVLRGSQEGAVVVLGSATPSMESYANTQNGKYTLLTLSTRVDDKTMPLVRVVDMRHAARKEQGTPVLAPQLKEAIHQRLERREQTILFLNRRGYATSLQCPLCGYVAECPNCSIALTYHRAMQRLRCHICGHDISAPRQCPKTTCRNPAIRYAGLGTEKVEEVLGKLFPQAQITRMDSDTLKRKDDYRRILDKFRAGKIDILLGTQMIAKGLHFPNVTLVGIIHADLSLHIPDFRAGERTFQLLTQVAGRSGRGDVEGEVYVQSFTPFHPAIQYARRHDFTGFFEQELEMRAELNYPPLSRVALITLKGRNEEKVQFVARHLRGELEKILSSGQFPDLILAGPAPAPLARAETFFRYQIMLRTKRMPPMSRLLSQINQSLKLPKEMKLIIDIDPMDLI